LRIEFATRRWKIRVRQLGDGVGECDEHGDRWEELFVEVAVIERRIGTAGLGTTVWFLLLAARTMVVPVSDIRKAVAWARCAN
jgi:hypothetical protein